MMNTDFYSDLPVTKLKGLYLSRIGRGWLECKLWELPLYSKYGYETKLVSGGLTRVYMLY